MRTCLLLVDGHSKDKGRKTVNSEKGDELGACFIIIYLLVKVKYNGISPMVGSPRLWAPRFSSEPRCPTGEL